MVTEQDSSFLSRAKERRVFLFEQIVIFSEPIDRKKGFSLPGYIFKNSIKVCLQLFVMLCISVVKLVVSYAWDLQCIHF